MTSDSNSDSEIDPERRTAIKSIGVLGTALTGLFGDPDKGFVPPDHIKDQNWKKGEAGCGFGRGKWCWGHGRGKGRDRGNGYERDHPHFDDDSHWHDNGKWWDDECPDEEPENADDDLFRDPEDDQGEGPESPEEDVDEVPDGDPAEGEDEEPEEDSDEDLEDEPEEDVDEEPDEDEEEPDEPEEDEDEDPEDDTGDEQDEELDGDLDEEPEGDQDEPEEDVDEEPDAGQDETDVATQIEIRIHEEVNDYRQANSLPPLDFDDELAAVARDHSQDMNDRDYFSHISPEGDGPGDRLDDAGIDCTAWAENIAYEYDSSFSEEDADSVAESIVNGWIDSPGHRQNILDNYDEQGIGVDIRDDGQIMATQMFCSNS